MKAILTVIILLIMVSPAGAMQNDTGGFRGAKWGESSKYINGLELAGSENGLQYFKLSKGSLMIAGVRALSISYAFWEDQLILVKIMVSDDSAVKLFRACKDRFGPPKNMSSVSGEWEGPRTLVKYSRQAEDTELILVSKKLILAKVKSDKYKSLRKKGW